LAACGGQGVLKSGDTYVLVGDDDGINTAGVGYGGPAAKLGQCLGLGGGVVGLWPPGTEEVSDKPLTIDVPHLGHVTAGDLIEGGGEDVWPKQMPMDVQVPSGCQNRRAFEWFPDG
jgi:hypothetical protein